MKTYSCPDEVKFVSQIDLANYSKYDHVEEIRREKEHALALKEWLLKSGYTGKNTGRIVDFGVADGCARYMIADGQRSALIHLPYCDAYTYRDVQFIPKKEIILRSLELNESFG